MALASSDGRGAAIAAINVTPMADVMIVLLIIFMIVIPVADGDPRLLLPSARHAATAGSERPLVEMRGDGAVTLDGIPVADRDLLVAALRTRLDAVPDGARLVHVRADASLPYPDVGRTLEACGEAGADEIVLLARPRLDGIAP